jgi:hypothetical protein
VGGLLLLRLRFKACTDAYLSMAQDESDSNVVNEPCPIWTKENAAKCGNVTVGCCWFA